MQCTPSLASLALYRGDCRCSSALNLNQFVFLFSYLLSDLQGLEMCPTFCLTNQRSRSPGGFRFLCLLLLRRFAYCVGWLLWLFLHGFEQATVCLHLMLHIL